MVLWLVSFKSPPLLRRLRVTELRTAALSAEESSESTPIRFCVLTAPTATLPPLGANDPEPTPAPTPAFSCWSLAAPRLIAPVVCRSTSSTPLSTSPRTVLMASAPPPESEMAVPPENDNASETAAEVALMVGAGSLGFGRDLSAVTARLDRDLAPPLIPRTRLST